MEVAASSRACLVADVGGTNARVGWTLDGQSVQDVLVLRCSDHASLAHILGSYLERMARSHPGMALREAVVAIAGYLQGDRLVNANLPWEVSVARTADAARLESLVLINDFGAVAQLDRLPTKHEGKAVTQARRRGERLPRAQGSAPRDGVQRCKRVIPQA